MIPILYDKYESSFLSNGLGQLGECLSCIVTEQVNGTYEVEFTYPMTGAYYEQLINFGGVLACTHDHNGDIQLFDIYKYSAPIDGIVTFNGSHVSYRLRDYWRKGEYSVSLSGIFADWNQPNYNSLIKPIGTFHFAQDGVDLRGEMLWYPIYNVREAMLSTSWNGMTDDLGNELRSVLQAYPGEWRYDNFNVYYSNKRGQDRGVQIRYGKNMSSILRERDTGGIVSAIIPMWNDGHNYPDFESYHYYDTVYSPKMEVDASPWYANGEQVYSDGIFYFNPPIIHAVMLDITDQFENEPTAKEARDYALSYMSKSSTWRADDNITVDFLDLYGTPEYEGIEGLSSCVCGDYVKVFYPQLGIVSKSVEIMSLSYDVLAERVIEMQLNTIKTTLAQVILDSLGG